ncbi:acyltransferase family protein, partial [Mucilaginibacter sp.]
MNQTQTIQIQKKPIKLNYIDLLRGIAILLVIVCHVSQSQIGLSPRNRAFLNFGRIGVQLFFFLSAYTLCLSMDSRKERYFIRNFYIRRYFRIAPLYYLGILIYFLVGMAPFLNQYIALSNSKSDILYNFLLIHGVIQSANNTIVPGGWSIGTEVLFYLMFPLLFLFYKKLNFKFIYIYPVLGLLIATLFSHIMYSFDESAYNYFYYYNIFNQLQVFLIGMSCYFLQKKNLILFSPLKSGLIFIILFALSFVVSFKLENNISLFVFLAGLSFLFLFIFVKKINLTFKAVQKIGELSYSIYIFHFLFAYPLVIQLVHFANSKINSYILFIICIIIVVVLSTGLA